MQYLLYEIPPAVGVIEIISMRDCVNFSSSVDVKLENCCVNPNPLNREVAAV